MHDVVVGVVQQLQAHIGERAVHGVEVGEPDGGCGGGVAPDYGEFAAGVEGGVGVAGEEEGFGVAGEEVGAGVAGEEGWGGVGGEEGGGGGGEGRGGGGEGGGGGGGGEEGELEEEQAGEEHGARGVDVVWVHESRGEVCFW